MHCSETVRKPEIWPVSLSQITIKMRKINRLYQNLISTEGGLDTSACQISGHSSNAFYRKCSEKLTCFTKSREINGLDQNLVISEVTRMHQHAKFQPILIMPSQENARKPKIWPVSQVKMQPKWGKSTDPDQNLISSKSGQDTSMHNFRPFFQTFFRTYPKPPNLTCLTESKCHQNEENQRTESTI